MMSSSVTSTADELFASLAKIPANVSKVRYYGAQIPNSPPDKSIVIHQLPTHKQFREICPTARFKEFASPEEASLFSRNLLQVPVDQNFRKVVEPKSPYPSPSQAEQDLIVQCVTEENVNLLRTLAWKNPRLLITPDDSPQCYKGTWRRNLLHMAVIQCSWKMFMTLVEIIENPRLAKATQLTQFENLDERRAVIISNYLNNRTKKEESVLDLAVMYGMIEIVDFLTVHPYCQMGISNRPAKEIVCSRASTDRKSFSAEILSMMNDRWYVPLIVSSLDGDGSIIGEPAPVEVIHKALREGLLIGLFGPSPLKLCQTFVTEFSSSRRGSRSTTPADVSDLDSSLLQKTEENVLISEKNELFPKRNERICRRLAEELGPWKEWWSFLGAFLCLNNRKGMELLENFLGKMDGNFAETEGVAVASPIIKDNLETVQICSCSFVHLTNSETGKDDELPFYTPPSSPEPEESYFEKFFTRHSKSRKPFLGGEAPSVLDYEVYDTLKYVFPIPFDLPYIRLWKSAFESSLVGLGTSNAESDELTEKLTKLSLSEPS